MLPPRAYVFIGLNCVRALSIIALLLVFSSNINTLVNDVRAVNRFMEVGRNATAISDAGGSVNATTTQFLDFAYIDGSTVPNQPAGAFWAVLNRLFIIFQTVVLLLSELGWPQVFFTRYFPVLGKDFGLGALGLIQMLIGAAVLSHHLDTFTLVSAFFLFSIGCLNVLCGLIFRQSAKIKRSPTAWKDHAKSALPTHIGPLDVRSVISNPPSFVSHLHTGKSDDSYVNEKEKFKGFGFGRQGEKNAGSQGYLIRKPVEALPRHIPRRARTLPPI